ncbi:3-oxoacyl-ACP reductase FabG [Actinomadura citrea]|uniref:3-oxoacyl-[acyl-carrier protein] reductase n=1 Tax=Actinomadura citrea TaxID=46158 RepID=A0A7Y9GFG8_9ACTN|nr:3-oxoacyl-ACP reductase FabG [Actinomadura citrea]NYE15416.1 3-oxoacyl-[acyl-carrier protein] reductase [Actinomadura citrea]GGT99399.1 beta-ketoacyl-ACP reductase [Actinomadura citrea]
MTRSVLVTGGNRGLGLAIARAFTAAGDAVAVTHRGSGAPDGLLGVKCDVTDSDQVARAFEEIREAHGPVEVLVSNAGITDDALLLRMREESFTRVIDTNLTGAYRVARAAVSDMIRARRGRMIFISSVAGTKGVPGQANYAASKAGLIGLARALARELAARGITSNVIAPGLLDTDMTSELTDRYKQQILDEVPLGRTATLEEIAAAAVWLASAGAASVTGQVITIDGGGSLGH